MDISAISAAALSAPSSFGQGLHSAQTPAAQRHAVAGQFEAIMLRQLLGDSIGAMMGGDSDGPASGVYGYMMTDVLSQKLAAGGGMGLSSVIEHQLTPAGEKSATPTTLSSAKSASLSSSLLSP